MDSNIREGGWDVEMGLNPASFPNPNYNLHMESPAPSPSPSPSPRAPTLVLSSSSKCLTASNSGKTLLVSNSSKALLVSNSGRRTDYTGRKKYVKQVTGRYNDTELHLAAQRDDLEGVRRILGDINGQMLRTLSGADFDAEVAEIRSAVVNEVNEIGETALFTAAERGHVEVVKELLPYTTKEGIRTKNRIGFDPLHVAANHGHHAIVHMLLEHDPELCKTVGQSNATPLISAATRGHLVVVNELLSRDTSLLEMSKSNGKNALHFAARQGHVKIVKSLLDKDPQLARRTDKKGQTALHMAVKGLSCPVVKLLLSADPAIVMLPDRFGNTALHVATRKKRAEIVNELLLHRDTNVNALSRDQKTVLDIAEGLPLSEESAEIKDCLTRCGALKANELNEPRDELRKTVTEIKKDVHTQLEQARRTYMHMNDIALELRKVHREGINNATNSVTVVASLFATLAFATIFTIAGGEYDDGTAVMASTISFKIFFLSNALALFTSLAVVLVQITMIRGAIKSETRVVRVINKLMWLASVCTTVAFVSTAYIVLGKRNEWAAILATVIGGVVMAGIIGMMTYYVVKSRKMKKRKREKSLRRGTNGGNNPSDLSDAAFNTVYAL